MPTYVYHCGHGHYETKYIPLSAHSPISVCACGAVSQQVITAPVLVAAQPECRYDSPIDGTPITSWAARRNDLAKHGCRPYDEGMKQDYLRMQDEKQKDLDASIEQSVERSIEKMSTAERGKLWNEVTRGGVDMSVERHAGT